jgi:hypothetical protein
MDTVAKDAQINYYKVLLRLPGDATAHGTKANGSTIYDLDFEYSEATGADGPPKDFHPAGTYKRPLFMKRPGKMQFAFRDDTGQIKQIDRIRIDFSPWRHGIGSPLRPDVEAKGEMGDYRIAADKMAAKSEIALDGENWNELVEQRQYYGLRVEIDAIDKDGKPVKLLRDDPEIVVDPQP